jgi:hypothetical protein
MRRNFNPPVEKMLGQILVERNILSSMRLQAALDRQKEQKGKYQYIGEILIEMGVPQKKINAALDDFNKRKPTGQIFLDLKVITPDQLHRRRWRDKTNLPRWPSIDLWLNYWLKWGLPLTMDTWIPFPNISICQSFL